MADRIIIRPPPEIKSFPASVSRWCQQVCNEINNIRSGTTFGENENTGYTDIEADGTIRFYLAATPWIDLDIDLMQSALGASAPDIGTVGAGTIKHLLFDGISTTEDVHGHKEINHDIKLDVLKPHLHWIPTTTDSGNVKWNLTYSITNNGDSDSETTISVVTAAPGAVQSTFSAFPDIDVSSFTAGAQFSFRLFRDPTDGDDTYAHDVATKSLGLHAERQSLGTRTTITD